MPVAAAARVRARVFIIFLQWGKVRAAFERGSKRGNRRLAELRDTPRGARDHADFDCKAIAVDWRIARRTSAESPPTEAPFHPTKDCAILSHMNWAIALILILGIGNFAFHRAVLESGHPLASQIPEMLALVGGRLSLLAEYAVLVGALLMAANGWAAIAWAYAGYSALNAMAAWLILTGRV
jgi:hypothetical protein